MHGPFSVAVRRRPACKRKQDRNGLVDTLEF